MENSLKGKRILITAGPTWVPIDDVRVVSNISTGGLGILLARQALQEGLSVDMFLGPVGDWEPDSRISVEHFRYFTELQRLLKKRLQQKSYDIILHAAAVSDYIVKALPGKMSSDKDGRILRLKRAPKLIEMIGGMNPEAFIVGFKLEARLKDSELIKRAVHFLNKTCADLVVANTFKGNSYQGLILDGKSVLCEGNSRKALAVKLFKILKEKITP